MGYVVVVFCLINTAAILAVGWGLWYLYRELPMYVTTAIGDEVRKQDDRIEKRLARVERPAGDSSVPEPIADGAMRVGRPYRRA